MRHILAAGAVAIGLRAADQADVPFLRRLHEDRTAPELAPLGWGAEQRITLVDLQFRAQEGGYGSAFPSADHWIVTTAGEAIGRMMVDRRAHEHIVVDHVLLHRWRGIGIGSALMQEVLADAVVASVPVRLTVSAHAPRLVRWYQRLGFSVMGGDDVTLCMACFHVARPSATDGEHVES